MKRIFFAIVLGLLSIGLIAQEDSAAKMNRNRTKVPVNTMYCVNLKDGKPVVIQNEKPLKNDVVLKNGNKLTTSGTLINKDGNIRVIQPGGCVDPLGEEIEDANK